MKKQFLAIMTTLAAISGFAADAPFSVETVTTPTVPHDMKMAIVEKVAPKNSFVYVRLGVADTQAYQAPQMNKGFFVPGAGLGWRLISGASAVDISANYTQGFAGDKESRSYFYSLPKVSYLRYLSPLSGESFYVGGGLALAEMRNINLARFTGMVPSVSVGYEMNRKANWHSFAELVVSQPALAFVRDGEFPGPLAEFSFGFGY